MFNLREQINMSSYMIDSGAMEDVAVLIAGDRQYEALRADMIARWLTRLPENTSVGLYGCGGTGRCLAEHHSEALNGYDVRFITSLNDEKSLFYGFPKLNVKVIADSPPTIIVLLSATYEDSMKLNLQHLNDITVKSMTDVITAVCTEQDCYSYIDKIKADAARVADEIHVAIPNTRSICFILNNFGFNALELFRLLRAKGFAVALIFFEGVPIPIPRENLVVEGFADYVHIASSQAYLNLFLPALMAHDALFGVVHCWTQLRNHEILLRLVKEARCPVVVQYDCFLPFFFEDKEHGEMFAQEIGQIPENVQAVSRKLYMRAAGVLIKDDPVVVDILEKEYGYRPRHVLCQLPSVVLEEPSIPSEKYSQRTGHLHVVYVQSLHRTKMRSGLFSMSYLFETVETITSQGIHFTVFNNLDTDGTNYRDLIALSRNNPLFSYRYRLPFEQLIEELRYYDFGWLGCDPQLAKILPTVFATNLQMKLLVYIHAGIPSLIAPEHNFCARLAEGLGVGLCVAHYQLPELHKLLANFDYSTTLKQLRKAQLLLDIKQTIPVLTAFIEEILSDKNLLRSESCLQ